MRNNSIYRISFYPPYEVHDLPTKAGDQQSEAPKPAIVWKVCPASMLTSFSTLFVMSGPSGVSGVSGVTGESSLQAIAASSAGRIKMCLKFMILFRIKKTAADNPLQTIRDRI